MIGGGVINIYLFFRVMRHNLGLIIAKISIEIRAFSLFSVT